MSRTEVPGNVGQGPIARYLRFRVSAFGKVGVLRRSKKTGTIRLAIGRCPSREGSLMRTTWIAGLISACLCATWTGSGWAADPLASYPLPQPMPTSVPAPVSSPTPVTEFSCPPVPCPPVPCPSGACPVQCRPMHAPRVRVIMTPPEVVFQQAGCAEARGWRKFFPGCAICKPGCITEAPPGAPQGVTSAPKPGQPQGVPGQPQGVPGQPQGVTGQSQGFQTVPVTTFHAVPVTTYQTVPVTTFHTIPVTGAATFGAQSFGVQSTGAQAFGAQAFGVQPFGAQAFGMQAFGAQNFGSPAAFGLGGFGSPFVSAGSDILLRLLLAALGKNQGGPSQSPSQGGDDLTRQFLELEKRIELLRTDVLTTQKDVATLQLAVKDLSGQVKENTKTLLAHSDDLEKLEARVNALGKALEESRKMPPPPLPPSR